VAWEPLGWTPVAFSEIEPFPSAVLAHRFPNVPNLGDMTKHAGWTLHAGSIDLLIGGTPCQSFSVAGLRKGLHDPRGGLMLTYLEIAKRLRPRWIVWENVPGVLSSNGGRDFGSFLGALGELGYGWAYRVLDAQWIRTQRHPRAVPQRRRRVFVVGCLGDWTAAAAVLFERESVCRDSAPRRAQRQATAADASGCAGAGRWWDGGDCAETLTKSNANGAQRMPDKDNFGAVLQPVVGALCAEDAKHIGSQYVNQGKCIVQPVAIQGNLINRDAGGPHGVGASDEGASYTLTKADVHGVAHPVAFQQNTRDEVRLMNGDGAIAGALAAEAGMKQQNYVAQPVPYDLFQITAPVNRQNRKPGDPCHTLARDNAAHAAVAFPIDGRNAMRDPDKLDEMNRQGMGVGDGGDPSHTVTSACVHAVAFKTGNSAKARSNGESFEVTPTIGSDVGGNTIPAVAFSPGNLARGAGASPSNAVAPTIAASTGDQRTCVAFTRCDNGQDAAVEVTPTIRCGSNYSAHPAVAYTQHGVVAGSLTARHDSSPCADRGQNMVAQAMTVRRLTPRECERLQGFPDDWTLIPWRKKSANECPDGPRYRALGNSMAVNCMEWIGQRIVDYEAR